MCTVHTMFQFDHSLFVFVFLRFGLIMPLAIKKKVYLQDLNSVHDLYVFFNIKLPNFEQHENFERSYNQKWVIIKPTNLVNIL